MRRECSRQLSIWPLRDVSGGAGAGAAKLEFCANPEIVTCFGKIKTMDLREMFCRDCDYSGTKETSVLIQLALAKSDCDFVSKALYLSFLSIDE